MSLKYKHYPHPVLKSQFLEADSDFINSFYEVNIQNRLSENKEFIELGVIFDLKNRTLSNLIKEKKAIFALLFVCESTSTRFLEYTTKIEEVFNIPTKNLNNTVMIHPYIIANEKNSNYNNKDLIDPIKNLSFDLKRGDILAISSSYELYIEKQPVLEVDSIFEIIENRKKNAEQFSVDPNGTKIKIYLPTEVYEKLKKMSKYSGLTSDILISLIYLPATINALDYLVSFVSDVEDLSALKDYNWYRTLENKFIELKLGKDLLELEESMVFEVAHQILEHPHIKALEALDNIVLGMEEN